jgi:hypothetical protein
MLNLHVHWNTPQAGVNDLSYDDLSLGASELLCLRYRESRG